MRGEYKSKLAVHSTTSLSHSSISAIQKTGHLPNHNLTGTRLDYVLTICALKRFVSLFVLTLGAVITAALCAILDSMPNLMLPRWAAVGPQGPH